MKAVFFGLIISFMASATLVYTDEMKRLPDDVDLHRPIYHFVPPSHWMNDPILYVDDRSGKTTYHLFYQYAEHATVWQIPILWGHAISDDLIHWKDLPVALRPSVAADELSVFTGSVIADGYKGHPTMFYTGVSKALPEIDKYVHGCEQQLMAYSTDPNLKTWTKINQPVVSYPPKNLANIGVTGFRDPAVIRSKKLDALLGKSGGYYMLVSGGIKNKGQATFFYSSDDLLTWEENGINGEVEPLYLHKHVEESGYFGRNMECSALVDFGEQSDKVLLMYGAEWATYINNKHTPVYSIGKLGYDQHTKRVSFIPSSYSLLDYGYVYAFNHYKSPDGRMLLMGWIPEDRLQWKEKWAGAQTLPREISIKTLSIWNVENRQKQEIDILQIKPVEEVGLLRKKAKQTSLLNNEVVETGKRYEVMNSCSAEIEAVFEITDPDTIFKFQLFQDETGSEVASLQYNYKKSKLTLKRKSTPEIEESYSTETVSGKLPLYHFSSKDGQSKLEKLRLRIFIDKSIVEVYANDRFAMTNRVYRLNEGSCNTDFLVTNGGMKAISMNIWTDVSSIYTRDTQASDEGSIGYKQIVLAKE
ncbi:glycosyl hydrolase [Paraphysoderma sedebokerense]|nr:glycosyl hydrolase [Paraphysoderma sedebokerense]